MEEPERTPGIKHSSTCFPQSSHLRSPNSLQFLRSENDEESELESDSRIRSGILPPRSTFYQSQGSQASSFVVETTEGADNELRHLSLFRKKDKIEAQRKEKMFKQSMTRRGSLFTKQPFTFINQSYNSRCCMLSISSSKRIKWDLFIMVLAVFTCFLVPFQIAFQTQSQDWIHILLNSSIDCVFFVDIILNFRTSYFSSKSGKQVTNPREIFNNYCLGRFWLDLIATIPFDRIYVLLSGGRNAQLFSIFGILKVFRVLRLSGIINNLNLRQQLKMTLKIVKLCFFLVLYVHVVACCWFYLVRQTEAWVPPLDFMWFSIYDEYGGSPPFGASEQLYDAPLFHKYWVSVYHSVMMLTGGEVGPRTTFETCFAALVILLGSIINANIFGHMAVLITSLEKNSSLFQERIDSMNTSMKNMRLSRKIQRRVQNYLLYTQSNHHHKQQLRSFLHNLSPSLQNEVLHFLFQDVIRHNPVLKQEPAQFHNTLVKKLEISFCQPDDQLISQGEPEKDAVYFIVRGECTVHVKCYKGGPPRFVKILRPGAMFGEIALLCNCKRTASIKSINYSIVGRLPHANFQFLCSEFPEVVNKLKREISFYNDPWKLFIKSVLKGVSYFQYLSALILNDMFTMLGDEFVKAGLMVLKEFDQCQSLVFITEGEVELCARNSKTGKLEVFDSLKQGSHIGQYWVLSGEEYNFSVRAKTDVTIHFLPCEVLVSLRQEYVQLENAMTKAEKELKQSNSYGGITCDISHRVTKSMRKHPIHKFVKTVQRMLNLYRIRRNQQDSKFVHLVGLAQHQHEESIQQEIAERNNRITTRQKEVAKQQFIRRNSTLALPRFSVLRPPPPIPTVIPPIFSPSDGERKIQEELRDQRRELEEIKALLYEMAGKGSVADHNQSHKKSQFAKRAQTTSPHRRISGLQRMLRVRNELDVDESLTRQAILKSNRMFKDHGDSPKSSLRFSQFYDQASHNPYTNRMASRLSLNSIARGNNPLGRIVPGGLEAGVGYRTITEIDQSLKTSKFIEDMEDLVSTPKLLDLRASSSGAKNLAFESSDRRSSGKMSPSSTSGEGTNERNQL